MDDSERAIIDATSRARCERGDANLPMQRLADGVGAPLVGETATEVA